MVALPKVSEKVVAISLRLLFLFNLIDAFLTLLWVDSGIAVEANPIRAYAMTYGMTFFVLIKISVVVFAIAILWSTRKHVGSRLASLASCFAMGCLVLYHVAGIFLASQPAPIF